jgi:trans-aconitate 2-methyltransferase
VIDTWDPGQYGRFAAERSQPFTDLLSMVERRRIARAVDLGCGPGELTRRAADELDVESMLGIDNSPAMLASAGAHSNERVTFQAGDIGSWTSAGDVDLVVASASLQWVPDHRRVLGLWRDALAPGGQLAVQVPANADAVTHRVARDVAATEQFRDAFGPAGPPPDPVERHVLRPEEYSQILYDLGFERQRVGLHVYPHVLDSSREIVEWVNGTTLTRFRSSLSAATYETFLGVYERALLAEVGDQRPCFFPFKRILVVAALGG